MHILMYTDHPLYPSAYGQQAFLLAPILKQLGYNVTIYCPSHLGMPMSIRGVTVVGGIDSSRVNPAALLSLHAERLKADILLTLKDPYTYDVGIMRNLNVPWVAICPVDTEPLSAANEEALRFASSVVAVSKTGAASLYRAGIEATYIPHMFDAKTFDIQPREDARKKLGLPQDVFIALFVGDNRTFPSRKNFEGLMPAWAQFIHGHSDAVLLLHTLVTPERGGMDVDAMIEAYSIPKTNVFISDQYQLSFGFPQSYLASLYNAANVLVLPSTGEGFGCPLIEAQLCGTPVITVDWTAMRELTFFGTRIATTTDVAAPIDTGQIEVTPIGGFRYRVNAKTICAALEMAFEHPSLGTHREIGRKCAMRFEVGNVVEKHWKPALKDMENLLVKGDVSGLL